MEIFSKGNRKLPKTTLIWDLPAGFTCPCSTKECESYCYARKAERIYPAVLPKRKDNLILSLNPRFEEIITNELIKLKNWNTVRIHSSGDFYSIAYFLKWVHIIIRFPNKIFYAYTKSLPILKEYIGIIPKNLILIYSDDDKKLKDNFLKQLNIKGRARVDNGSKILKSEYLCPNDCKKCNYCYKLRGFKKIVFKKH